MGSKVILKNEMDLALFDVARAGKLRPERCLFHAVIENGRPVCLIGVKANMFKPEQVGKRTRYTYAKINEVIKMPHLLDIQRKSYEWFLESGLQIFSTIFLRLKTIQVI